jgi:hypothetical protein
MTTFFAGATTRSGCGALGSLHLTVKPPRFFAYLGVSLALNPIRLACGLPRCVKRRFSFPPNRKSKIKNQKSPG